MTYRGLLPRALPLSYVREKVPPNDLSACLGCRVSSLITQVPGLGTYRLLPSVATGGYSELAKAVGFEPTIPVLETGALDQAKLRRSVLPSAASLMDTQQA